MKKMATLVLLVVFPLSIIGIEVFAGEIGYYRQYWISPQVLQAADRHIKRHFLPGYEDRSSWEWDKYGFHKSYVKYSKGGFWGELTESEFLSLLWNGTMVLGKRVIGDWTIWMDK